MILTAYTWSASGAGNANVAGNWTPNGVPASTDTVSFSSTSVVNCNWNITTVSSMVIGESYTGLIDFAQNATIKTGLSIESEGRIKSSSTAMISFDGTPAHNSNKTFVLNKCANPFDSATSRSKLTYKFPSTPSLKLDAGIYPHIQCHGGFRPEYTAPSFTANKYTVKLLSLSVHSNCTPTSATPTADDRLMNWIIEDVVDAYSGANQFVSGTALLHDMGYGTWTFQAKAGGWSLPVSGNPLQAFGGSTFTWRKMIIASTKGGNGSFVSLPHGSILSLNDLTINSGAGMKGDDSRGATIHLVNRPTIKGTWGFYPIADGIYYYKGLYNLNVAFGGTGLTSVASGRIPFGSNPQALNTSSQLTFAGNTLHADHAIKLTEGADHPFDPTGTGTGLLWVKINGTNANTLIFTDDTGADTVLGSGGGSGDITAVTIQTDSGSGSKATDTEGSADFSLLGANGVGITNSGATITAVAVPAEIDHDALSNFVANEHLDWTTDRGSTNIHAGNYTDTNTQLSNAQVRTAVEAATDSNVFTDADHTKLNGVEATATKDHIQGGQQNDIATGWWTFAVVKGRNQSVAQRAQAQFYITDSDSGRHRTAHIGATHMFGTNGSNSLQLYATSSYGNGVPFDGFRIKEGDTYDGAALQINITNAGNRINQFMMDNFQSGVYGLPGYGWTLLDTWLADSDTNGHNSLLGYGTFAFNTDMAVSCDIDLDDDANPYYGGGMGTTGSLFVDKHTRLGGTHTVSNEALTVNGNVMIQDSPTSSDGSDQYLTVKSNADSARIVVSADTDVKVPAIHLIDSEANSGNFSQQHSAYFMLDRGNNPLFTGQNHLIIANTYPDKDIHFATNTGSAGTEAALKMVVKHDGKVGIGITAPENPLHVKTTETIGDAAYAARFQAAEGNVGITRYGGIHLDNDNTSPTDGAAWSSNRWQIGTRDGNQLDFAYGAPTNTNVAASATDLRITSAGKVGIGLAATDPDYELHVNGAVGFRAPVEVIATNPSPAITESGTVFYMTNAANAAISFTLPANGVAGVQYVIINTLGANITIDSATSSDKINGSTNAVVNTTANAATTVVCVGTVSGVIQWAAFGGI